MKPAALALLVLSLSLWSATAVTFVYRKGYILYNNDGVAHLNIARRILDSRTPGYEQIGTVWLPLPHALMLPFAKNDYLWRSGLAGAIPSAACFVTAAVFLFAAAERIFENRAASVTATALFALNPNLMYLQSTPMTEAIFYASLGALLYFTVRFRHTQSAGALLGAAVASALGALTRYEGWFLIPFAAAFFALAAKRQRLAFAALYCAVAALGPLYWLAHNRILFGDYLEFYRGPYSAKAIQGGIPYPGNHNWRQAAVYFLAAARLCLGIPLLWLGAAGILAMLRKRQFWPVLLLALCGFFYIWSIQSSAGSPIFVPHLWPYSYYNTRYGLALLPLAALSAAALVILAPRRFRPMAAAVVILVATHFWLIHPGEQHWITWKESQVNSRARRMWTQQAADFLKGNYRPGDGIFTDFGDLTGILLESGVPLRQSLTIDNEPHWLAATARPDLFLWEGWAIAFGGDKVQTAINRAQRRGPYYALEKRIVVKGAPVVEIYRRVHPWKPQ